jgi:hypothetical protein
MTRLTTVFASLGNMTGAGTSTAVCTKCDVVNMISSIGQTF